MERAGRLQTVEHNISPRPGGCLARYHTHRGTEDPAKFASHCVAGLCEVRGQMPTGGLTQ